MDSVKVVTPRLATPANEDVEVVVAVDKATVDAFNKANNLALVPIDAQDIVLTNEAGEEGKGSVKATIKKGSVLTRVAVNMPVIDARREVSLFG